MLFLKQFTNPHYCHTDLVFNVPVEAVAQPTSHSKTEEKKNRSINKLTFQVPSYFRLDIQQLLEAKRPLNFNQLSAVGRTIGDAIESQTHCPDSKALNLAIALVMGKHPNLTIGKCEDCQQKNETSLNCAHSSEFTRVSI